MSNKEFVLNSAYGAHFISFKSELTPTEVNKLKNMAVQYGQRAVRAVCDTEVDGLEELERILDGEDRE